MKKSFSAAVLFAGVLAGCFGTNSDPKDPETTTVLATIKLVSPDGMGDTSLITYTYDTTGTRVRERFHSLNYIVWDYDSLGRYIRWTQPNTSDTLETVTWITADSSARGSQGSSLITRERWFGLRANCRCADSLYRYSFNGNLSHIRRFSYDAEGNLVLVTRDYISPARHDTAQRYENSYADARLVSRMAFDHEMEDTTRQFFVYKPLDSLLEAR